MADSNRDNGEEDNKAFVTVGGVLLSGVLSNLCWFPPPPVTHDSPGGGGGVVCPGSVLYRTGSLGRDWFFTWLASRQRPLTLMELKVFKIINFVIEKNKAKSYCHHRAVVLNNTVSPDSLH